MVFVSVWIVVLIQAAYSAAWNPDCITSPVGFGRNTTGGAGGRTVTPTSLAQLKTYASSNETLIIDLTTTFDFTNDEGFATAQGCIYNNCGSGSQKALNLFNACNGKSIINVTYSVAGSRKLELTISSNKTLMSSNGKGVIKGKGVRIFNATNVIIRDITISDINPDVIWAGDAIVLNSATNVWIHKCTVRNVGRQHLVSYVQVNTGVTVSSCLFDGNTKYSLFCDGAHYWMWLFWGTRDEITMINNRVVAATGRLPHAGGMVSSNRNLIHMIGNEMDTNTHQGIQSFVGGYVLAEGNKWISYTETVDPRASGGFVALIDTATQAAACSSFFGENCKVNAYQNTTAPTRLNLAVLDQFAKHDLTAINGARAAVCEV